MLPILISRSSAGAADCEAACGDVTVDVERLEGIDADRWNAIIGQVPEARVQQSFQGPQVRMETEGIASYFLTAQSGGEIVGSLCLFHGFIHPDLVPWCRSLLRTPLLRRLVGVYRWLGGR